MRFWTAKGEYQNESTHGKVKDGSNWISRIWLRSRLMANVGFVGWGGGAMMDYTLHWADRCQQQQVQWRKEAKSHI